MSSNNIPTSIHAERVEIHKSCKTLETVVNVLNDYCEAANVIVLLQKKLSKALREAAATKCNPEIASNALIVSATIFDALAEVDSKFAKIADKECDTLSAEVKKWFKKLAKEEKAHDDRITTANARIKQAGQNYEKKAKKNARDAAEEHTRYINLLSALGPEMSQEKYNHASFVAQKHMSTTYTVASCLSHVADAEWLRYCEGVRRSAPSIGELGEWKSLCEGGWTGPVTLDLPNLDSRTEMASPPTTLPMADDDRQVNHGEIYDTGTERRRPVDPQAHWQYRRQVDSAPSLNVPVQFPTVDDSSDNSRGAEEPQAASLDDFPSPPNHIPLPHINSRSSSPTNQLQDVDGVRQPSSQSQHRRLSLRKVSGETPLLSTRRTSLISDSPKSTMVLEARPLSGASSPITETPPQTGLHRSSSLDANKTKHSVKHLELDLCDQEFGVQEQRAPLRAVTMDTVSSKGVERHESNRSSGSVVAAMRNRYTQSPASSPPPQSQTREPPRIPVSVSDIASRFQSVGTTTNILTSSPLSEDRRRDSADISSLRVLEQYNSATGGNGSASSSRYSNSTASITQALNQDDLAARRRRIEEIEELEIRERAQELRIKEREIQLRERELELERAEMFSARILKADSGNSRAESNASRSVYDSQGVMTRPRYSYSTTHLVPPSSDSSTVQREANVSRSRPASPASSRQLSQQTPLNSSYEPSAKPTLNAYTQLKPDKPKGWMRRLSMPVMSPFESKKVVSTGHVSSAGLANQEWRSSLAMAEEISGNARGPYGAAAGGGNFGMKKDSRSSLGMDRGISSRDFGGYR